MIFNEFAVRLAFAAGSGTARHFVVVGARVSGLAFGGETRHVAVHDGPTHFRVCDDIVSRAVLRLVVDLGILVK